MLVVGECIVKCFSPKKLIYKKEKIMNSQVSNESLCEKGFTEAEIESLNNLRRNYKSEEESLRENQQRRLEFVRWLVLTGKMTENLA